MACSTFSPPRAFPCLVFVLDAEGIFTMVAETSSERSKLVPKTTQSTPQQDDANMPQDEEIGIGSSRGELSILPTVEEIRPHREGISPATASEEKTAADTRGQEDQTSRATLNPLFRLFRRGQVRNYKTMNGGTVMPG